MKIHWFSPLPPARTAIATYAAGIIPALARQAELVLWTDTEGWDPALERHGEVRRYDAKGISGAELEAADAVVYHMGNNPFFHGAIWDVSRRFPGVVVLHELRMQHLFVALFRDQLQDWPAYEALMERYHGQPAREAAEAFARGEQPLEYLAEHYPLTGAALEGARGVVVHTHTAFETLRPTDSRPMLHTPLPYAPEPAPAPRAALVPPKRRPWPFGLFAPRPEPYRLVVFGYLGYNRRLEAILDALGGLRERERFHLDIYGQHPYPEQVEQQVGKLGLRKQVALHGFVSDADLSAALDRAHLAFNLRNPTMGEASFSQLQIWEHALPSLVTPIGAYAAYPEDAVSFVRPEREVEDIQEHLRRFLADPESFFRKGRQGRQVLEDQHSPEQFARALLDFARTLPQPG